MGRKITSFPTHFQNLFQGCEKSALCGKGWLPNFVVWNDAGQINPDQTITNFIYLCAKRLLKASWKIEKILFFA